MSAVSSQLLRLLIAAVKRDVRHVGASDLGVVSLGKSIKPSADFDGILADSSSEAQKTGESGRNQEKK